MASTKDTIEIAVDTGPAIAELKKLEEAFEKQQATVEATNKALEETFGKKKAAELKKFADEQAAIQAAAAKKAETEAKKEADKLKKAVEGVKKSSNEIRQAFAESIGFGELRDKVKEYKEAVEIAGDSSRGVGDRAAAGFTAAAKVIGTAVETAKRFAAALHEVARASAAGEKHSEAVRSLGGAYAAVQQATLGVVTAEEALHTQQALVQSGHKLTAQDLATITGAAREYARATGGDTTQALEQLTDAMIGLEEDGLQKFGVSVNTSLDRASKFKSVVDQLSDAHRNAVPSTESQAETLKKLEQQVENAKNELAYLLAKTLDLPSAMNSVTSAIPGVVSGISTVGDAAVRAGLAVAGVIAKLVTFGQMGDSLLAGATSSDPTAQRAAFRGVGEIGERVRAEVAAGQRQQREVANDTSEELPSTSLFNSGFGGDSSSQRAALEYASQQAGLEAMLASAYGAEGTAQRARNDRLIARRNRLRAASEERARQASIRGDEYRAGGGGGTSVKELKKNFEESFRAAVAAGVQFEDLQQRQGESFEDFGKRLQDVITVTGHAYEGLERRRGETVSHALTRITNEIKTAKELQDRLKDLMQQAKDLHLSSEPAGTYDAEIDAALERMRAGGPGAEGLSVEAQQANAEAAGRKARLQKELDQQQSVMHQLSDATKEFLKTQKTGAAGVAEVWSSTMGTMTGAFKSHLAAVITGKETIGEALKGILQDTLLNLATESAVKSIFELAQGVAAAASYRYAEAGQHFIASGAYATVATVAGFGTYGLSQIGASSSANTSQAQAASRSPASSFDRNTDTTGAGATYVINVNGALLSEGVQDGVVRALDLAATRGIMPRTVKARALRAS